jgi:TP901 family phage tail tape measure protein
MTSLASYTVAGGVLYSLISGFQSAVSSVAEFDQALKNLQAITQASQTDIKLLGDEIVRVSTRTKYNLAEVAEGATIIGQAGYSASETMSILGATMELAQGTMSSTATSADLLTTTLQAFRMEAKDAGLAADVMAVAVNKSKLDIDKLRTVFNYIGPVAQQANLSIREAAAATMVLANNGMKASTIGTALRNIFAQLSSPTAKLRTAFRESGTELGMTTEEINASLQIVSGQVEGRVVPLAERLAELNKMLGANADFLKLFGLRAGGAASILVEFPETIKQMEEDLYNVGLAHQMAEKQMEGLANTARNTIAALSGLVVVLGETWGSTLQAILKGFNDFIIGVTRFLQTDAGTFVSTFLSIATAVGGATVAVMGLTRALRSLAATSTTTGLLSTVAGVFGGGGTNSLSKKKALAGRGAKTASVVAKGASGAGTTGLLGRIAGIGGAAVTAMGGWTGVALAGVATLLTAITAYVKTYESASVRAYKNASIAAQEHASALGTLNVAIEAIEKRKLSDGSSASISNVLEIARQNPDYADRLLRTESNAEVLPLLREIRASRESALRASNISALQALIGAQRRASEEASAERSGRYLERIAETFGEDSEEYALATRDTVSNLRKYNDALSEATGNLTSFTTSLADQWVKSDAFRSVIEKGVADSYASGKAVDPSVIMENLQGPIVDMWNSSFGSELGNITKFSDLKNIEGGKFFIEPLLSAIFAAVQGTGRKIDEGKISDFVVNRRIAQDTLNRMAAEGQYRTAVLDAAYNQGALTTIDYERQKSVEAILTATQQLEYAQKYLAEAKKLPDTDTNKSTEVARASLSVSTAETTLQQVKENARLAERNALYDAQSRKIQKLTADLGGEYAVLQNRGADYLSLLNVQYDVETRTRNASIALLDQKLAGMGTEAEMEQWRIERQNLINEGLQKEFERNKALESFRDRDIEADVRSGRRSAADYQNYLDRQLRDNQISPSDYRYAWATRGAGADSWVNGLSAGFTRVIEQSKTFNEYMADLAVTIHDDIMQSIDDMVDSWVDGTLSMKDAFKNLSNAIAKDILKSTIKGWFNDLWTGGGGFGAEKGGVVGNNISALGFIKNLFSSNGTAASETASVEQALTDPVAESAAETVKIAQQEQVTLSSIWESIQNTASSAYNGMVQGIREFGGVATSILGSVLSVFSVFSSNSGGGFMDKLYSGVTAVFGIGKMVGSIGGMFSDASAPAPGVQPTDEMGTAIMTDFSKMPELFSAKGNVFRGLQSFSNSVVDDPTVFGHAGRLPAYAKGGAFGIGVMGEAGAEAIMPLRRNSSGELVGDGSGLGGTVINNINITPPNGYKAEESRERNENGGEDINVVFSRIIAREVSSPGSPVYRAMQNTFNSQQSLVSR